MKKILISLLASLMILMSVAPVFAADPVTPPTAGTDSKYADLKGETTTFTKYLITNQGQDIPSIEFKYTIEPGKAVKADNGTFEIIEGTVVKDNAGNITAPKFDNYANFEAKGGTDTGATGIWTTVQDGDTLDAANLTSDKQYSKDYVKVDFSGIKFTEPGVYRYIITEQKVDNQVGITYDIEEKKAGETDGSMKRVLDVYVVDDPLNEGTLKIQEYVLHTTVSSIRTTEGNGSKDENLDETVATGWQISDDPTVTYKTKEEAQAELDRRKSWPTDDPNYDSSILAKQKEIDELKKGTDGNDTDYGTAGTDGIAYAERDLQKAKDDASAKQTDVDKAQKAVDDLENGTSGTQQDIIDALNALTDASDERYDSGLEACGKNKLVDALNGTTDTKWITVLRRVISKIEPKLTAANSTLSQKKSELADAQAKIDAKKAVLDARNEDLKKLEAELTAFVKAHNDAKVVEVTWKLKDKSDHYTNKISVYDLYFSKEVKGNQGSRDKYFKFDLTINGLKANQAVKLDGNWTKTITDTNKGTATTYAADAMTTANNVTELTADSDGKIEHDFYLKHGEYISVLDLQEGAKYELTEASEDYKSKETNSIVLGEVKQVTETYWYIYNSTNNDRPDKVNNEFGETVDNKFTTEDDAKGITENTTQHQGWNYASETVVKVPGQAGQACTDPVSDTMTKNIYTGFTNTRNGIIPTGLIMSISGGLAIVTLAIVLIVFINRRREDEYEA